MNFPLKIKKGNRKFAVLYAANFLFSFHLFFVIYFHSSFLGSRGISEGLVGTIFIIGSVIGITTLLLLPRVLQYFGNYNTILWLGILEFLIFISLSFTEQTISTIIVFIVFLVTYPLIILSLDIFLESITKNEEKTGNVRGIFLTTTNTSLVLAPLLAGLILNGEGFEYMYLISAAFLIPFLIIINRYFNKFTDPIYECPTPKATFLSIKKDKDVRNIFFSRLSLRIFFSFMVIYTPIYLHTKIGFSFLELGVMFAIMLLPFALFELPLGKIADSLFGEKEILIIGFIITAFATLSLSFITSTNFIIWTAILFLTRTGASAVEIATESYFFKHVDGGDASIISFFRIARPISYIIGPALGSIILIFVDLRFVFIAAGIIPLLGILSARQLKDTK